MKEEQVSYELQKSGVLKHQGTYFKEHKEEIIAMATKMRHLSDTATVFENVLSDTTYLHEHHINITFSDFQPRQVQSESSTSRKNTHFLNSGNWEHTPINDLTDVILKCDSLKNYTLCHQTHQELFEKLLTLDYVFIEKRLLHIKPKMQGESDFQGGLFFSKVNCYDLKSGKAFYQFMISATSSNQIQQNQFGFNTIDRDLTKNINQARKDAVAKHFFSY